MRLLKWSRPAGSGRLGAGERETSIAFSRPQRELLDSIPHLVWVIDSDRKLIYCNSAWSAFTGVTLAECAGKDAFALVHPDDAARTSESWARAVESGERFECEHRIRGATGEYRWFLSCAAPERKRAGCWLGTSADIQATKELQDRYRTLFETAPDSLFLGEILRDSPQGAIDFRLLGASPSAGYPSLERGELARKTGRELFPWLEDRVLDMLARVAETGEPARFDVRNPVLDRDFECCAYRPASGQFAVLCRDVTDHLRADLELRAREERLHLAIESTEAGIFDLDPQTATIVWFDFRARQSPEEEVEYASFLGRVHPEDRERVDRAVQDALVPEGGGACEVEFRAARAGTGEERWLSAWGRTLFDPGGHPIRFVGLWLDITQRKRIESQAAETQKWESIGVLAAGIGHEFNNLLTTILGNAGLLAPEVPPRSLEMLSAVQRAGERAARLTQQLLAYAGKGLLPAGPVDLNQVILEMEPVLESLIPRGVAFSRTLANGLPRVETGRKSLEQLVMNLVVNASEAFGSGQTGTIHLQTSVREIETAESATDDVSHAPLPVGRYVCLEVSDTGSGFDEATRARIFDPFFTTKFLGRGLGLAAAAGVVRAYRGGIQVESSPGLGSTFRVLLPAEPSISITSPP